MNIPKILQEIRPGAEWALTGSEYSGLEWMDKKQSKPTLKEIKDYEVNIIYKENRIKEYPPITDQLDAIFKGGQDFDEMKSIIESVKLKYPKPE